jgi:prepilin-type N-terminal cleavage/methylation domain-containing protein
MKKSARSSSRSGFTLVELLVVIAIIAILASVVVAGANGAINAAKRVKANNAAAQLQTAIMNYYTEYGVYPVPSTAATGSDVFYSDSDYSDQQPLMYALCGNINAYNPQTANNNGQVSNSRDIAFLTLKKSDVDTNGVLINPFFTSATAQQNNGYFNVAMDADYSGVLGDTGGIKLPDFSGTIWKTGSTEGYVTSGITQGVAIWADCDTSALPPNEGKSTSPNFWVHTY